jgi:hypothetical protein
MYLEPLWFCLCPWISTSNLCFDEWLVHVSINPLNEAAKKGLERLEKHMKGVDPDALEDEEENEGEDADADPEEGEFP